MLRDADVRRTVEAAWEIDAEGGWDGDLGRLMLVLASTGARFSQVVRTTVADVQVAQKRLMVPTAEKAAPSSNYRISASVSATMSLPRFKPRRRDAWEARRFFCGRAGATIWTKCPLSGLIFQWVKGERSPWRLASELTLLWCKITARAGLPASTVPYCLRHSRSSAGYAPACRRKWSPRCTIQAGG